MDRLPPLFMVPLHEIDDRQGVLAMRDVGEVLKLAHCSSVELPDESRGTENLIELYNWSSLASFHKYFYEAEHDAPQAWPETYDRTPLNVLPPCARRILEWPNDLLLKPAAIQHIVRVLLALGWHPRHIAGLIRSKYERDFGWGDYWYLYDAATRADFYVRLFAGLLATGRDELIDFNCRSTQEKGYCVQADCGENLVHFRDRLLAGDSPGHPLHHAVWSPDAV